MTKPSLNIIKTQTNSSKDFVESVLLEGSEKAKEVSTPLIEDVRKAVGIKGF